MAEEFVLHPFRPRDAPLVAGWVTSAGVAANWAGTAWPVAAAVFERWHADPEIRAFVLNEAAEPVAYGEVWVDAAEQEVELGRLLVAPSRRGQGVGRRLVRLLLEQAALSGFGVAFVRVVPENDVALRCYRHSGFEAVAPDEQQRHNQGQPVAYVWMQYRL